MAYLTKMQQRRVLPSVRDSSSPGLLQKPWQAETIAGATAWLPTINHSSDKAQPQAKLTISQPGDSAEQEAEQVADHVMRMQALELSQAPAVAMDEDGLQRKCAECEQSGQRCPECQEEGKQVARHENRDTQTTSDAPPLVDNALLSEGQPLDADTRAFMEPRFGHDFSKVRVHADARASQSAQAVNALAYAVGSDVVFRSGQYAPDTADGQRLLAHELTHVVQQGGASSIGRIQRQEDDGGGNGGAEVGQEVTLPEIAVESRPTEVEAYGKSVHLEGKTNGQFKSSGKLLHQKAATSKGCDGCAPPECVHVTGTLQFDFNVTTTVSLPKVSDFPDLTPCEKKKVQDAINNILAPHEQQHVKALRTYNGKVQQAFDRTLCKGDVESTIQSLLDGVDVPRQAQAQAASDALDPFNFDFDLDCDDDRSSNGGAGLNDGTQTV